MSPHAIRRMKARDPNQKDARSSGDLGMDCLDCCAERRDGRQARAAADAGLARKGAEAIALAGGLRRRTSSQPGRGGSSGQPARRLHLRAAAGY
eukprot:360154-Chlamydomonas_euryale.AAC.2